MTVHQVVVAVKRVKKQRAVQEHLREMTLQILHLKHPNLQVA